MKLSFRRFDDYCVGLSAFLFRIREVKRFYVPFGDRETNQNERKPVVLFFAVIFFYCLHQIVTQPNWVLGGGMFAEMATDYYPNAKNPSLIERLIATDAGYIPLLGRLIALFGNVMHLPASVIPYYYTWTAIIATGIMVGTFCLPVFRKVVQNDTLRFCASIGVLLCADFETRLFLSFTYFGAFFIAIVSALALVDEQEDVPRWAWFVPILAIAKPGVLATVPAVVVIAFFSRSRFRWIAVVTFFLCLAQLVQMTISLSQGMHFFGPKENFSVLSQIIVSFKYFIWYLGLQVSGMWIRLNPFGRFLSGLLALICCAALLVCKRHRSNSLVLVGLSLAYCSVLINSFALSRYYNLDVPSMPDMLLGRWWYVTYIGCVLVVCGSISSIIGLCKNKKFLSKHKLIESLIFVAWFVFSGWIGVCVVVSKEPTYLFHSSQWQNMASHIDDNSNPMCVPINPWQYNIKWYYGVGCRLFENGSDWESGKLLIRGGDSYEIPIPAKLADESLVSLVLLVKPISRDWSYLNASLEVQMKDGTLMLFSGSNKIHPNGGFVLLTGTRQIRVSDVSKFLLKVDKTIFIAMDRDSQKNTPGVSWMIRSDDHKINDVYFSSDFQ